MNYKEAIDFIHSTYKFGSKLGLNNITKLTELLGNPQNSYKIIHVAGTNGKGSTSNMLHDVLMEAGYKTGLFISPYLEEFTERIQINKKHINKESLAKITTLVKEKIDIMISEGYNHPTEFEVVTAIGFKYFEEQKIDFLILEVGLGGRFDATNVVRNTLVSIITSIGFDHMQYLGNTLEEIAFEKSGIIKDNSNVVIYPQEKNIINVLKKVALERNANIYEVNSDDIKKTKGDLTGQWFEYFKTSTFKIPELKINLLGEHQLYNALTALNALEVIKNNGYDITSENIQKGFASCRFPGRFEILSNHPVIILDGGHNYNGIEYFSKAIKEYFNDKKIILFYGMLKDKNPNDIFPLLLPLSKKMYTLTPNNPRAMSAFELADLIKIHSDINVSPVQNYKDILNIINDIDKDEIIAFVGSLYMIGEVRTLLMRNLFNKPCL
ncbi:bifunctional folylpolyglutamate synthase/dihydrofolate synthase [Sedimentibacter sp. MB31-C6]|uniref:bifunctional folylpolyglutamate synthase/dihydrofolate synthase n=1 Tax=Sedimentibacter sp. MB31-C6 TaxID=3109366 RepID=UPI002DDD220F|nr:folylpolyglutamate synthase/dihydrofolate synthase family protein [Sedimentibacter sp. MB36-C1]WSI03902.1 folylpolyglutamate synthase/dihydrofolate synthase family protein [Sedimentibacter sp. MB36-C1]